MKTKAVIARELGKPFEIVEAELDGPHFGEVLVKWKVAGLCHSDLHLIDHDFGLPLPAAGGHEISGVVAAVGPSVTSLKPGDRVVACLIAYCGACARCLAGQTTLCLNQEAVVRGPEEKPRLTLQDGTPVAQSVNVGGFAEQVLVHENQLAVVNEDIPFPQAALIGCSVVTGAGAAINTAHVRPGDTVAVVGVGGIGLDGGEQLDGALQVAQELTELGGEVLVEHGCLLA